MRLSHFPIGTKVKTQYWPTDTWVEIRFIDRVGNYHCTDNHNNHVVHFDNDDKTWQIWQEPKKKVEEIENKILFNTKLCLPGWPDDHYVLFHYEGLSGKYYGLTHDDRNYVYSGPVLDWRRYDEPKRKVIRWKWVYQTNGGWWESDAFYTEDEMNQVAYHFHEAKKLEYTATEFED